MQVLPVLDAPVSKGHLCVKGRYAFDFVESPDRLTTPLVPVMWGVPAKDDKQYFNQRSEAWGTMRDFLEHGQIPDDDELADQLTSLDYGYDALFRIQLQSKKDMKKNGGKSPDCADSLAISFVPELIDRKVVRAKAKRVEKRRVVWSR